MHYPKAGEPNWLGWHEDYKQWNPINILEGPFHDPNQYFVSRGKLPHVGAIYPVYYVEGSGAKGSLDFADMKKRDDPKDSKSFEELMDTFKEGQNATSN